MPLPCLCARHVQGAPPPLVSRTVCTDPVAARDPLQEYGSHCSSPGRWLQRLRPLGGEAWGRRGAGQGWVRGQGSQAASPRQRLVPSPGEPRPRPGWGGRRRWAQSRPLGAARLAHKMAEGGGHFAQRRAPAARGEHVCAGSTPRPGGPGGRGQAVRSPEPSFRPRSQLPGSPEALLPFRGAPGGPQDRPLPRLWHQCPPALRGGGPA